jgi:hypothetical protein
VVPEHCSIKETMRIAQIAPLAESVPPKLYGGTERVVAWLIDELVQLGHDVTLFASGDSVTRAKLCPAWPRALRLGRPRTDPAAACTVLLELMSRHAGNLATSAITKSPWRTIRHHATWAFGFTGSAGRGRPLS